MKKLAALLFALVMMLSSAMGEAVSNDATLIFAYGDEAFNLHMLDMPNTINHDGYAWLLDHDGTFHFEGQFMLYGGNTRTVHEMEVPQMRWEAVPEGDALHVGTVIMTPPAQMTLSVYTGDRTTGAYTLMDCVETSHYELPIIVERDENGRFYTTDMVFLYTYTRDRQPVYYAATLYIGFEGYRNETSSQRPSGSQGSHGAQNSGNTADTSKLEEELSAQREYIADLEIQISVKDARIAELEGQLSASDAAFVSMLSEIGTLNILVSDQLATITALEGEKATLEEQNQAQAARIAELEGQVSAFDAASADMLGEIDRLNTLASDQLTTITALEGEKATLQEQNQAQSARIAELEGQVAFYRNNGGLGGSLVGEVTHQASGSQATDYAAMTDEELLARRAELEAEIALIDSALAE